MKKIVTYILLMALVLSLCACGTETPGSTEKGQEAAPSFQAGFARINITPKEIGVNMRGFGDEDVRLSTGIISYIYADCLAMTDELGNTALVLSLDIGGCSVFNDIRTSISDTTGVPFSNIVVSCSHQHSGPADSYYTEYKTMLIDWCTEVAVKALADRAPATMETTMVETQSLNFVRHYVMNDGTYAGDNFGSTESGYKAHTTEPDRTLRLIRFNREGDKKNILLANFQGHPHMASMKYYTEIHSDTVGVFRDTVSEQLGCEVIYFSGAGGNVKMTSAIEEENLTKDHRVHGALLASYAVNAQDYVPLASGTISALDQTYTGKVNHDCDYLRDVASEVVAEYNATHKNGTAMLKAAGYPVSSVHHAKAILRNFSLGSTLDVDHLGAIAVGDLAFVAAPYEMFSVNGEYIKANSPFEVTVVATIANGGNGYMASAATYDYGGYEADTSRFVKGTAEELADTFLAMLEQLHK